MMQQTPPLAAPFEVDRAPLNAVNGFVGTLGVHGATQRWIYTAPAARTALAALLKSELVRVTAGGSGTFSLRNGTNSLLSLFQVPATLVGDPERSLLPISLTILAGDDINGLTFVGTGGTMLFSQQATVLEVDA